MEKPQLYMILLGASPKGRNIEQHDMFFGIGTSLQSLLPEIKAFWPEAKDKIHIDAYRIVNKVDNFRVEVVDKGEDVLIEPNGLFFLNLGGYLPNQFEELHYKMLVVASEKGTAIKQAKETAFYKHTSTEVSNATSHIDDKFGVDVDDVFEIADILSQATKSKYKLKFIPDNDSTEDPLYLGYLPLKKL